MSTDVISTRGILAGSTAFYCSLGLEPNLIYPSLLSFLSGRKTYAVLINGKKIIHNTNPNKIKIHLDNT